MECAQVMFERRLIFGAHFLQFFQWVEWNAAWWVQKQSTSNYIAVFLGSIVA